MRDDGAEYEVSLTDASDEAKADAGAALYRHNVEQTGIDDRKPIGARLVSDGNVVGGLWGRPELGLLFLDMFFLPKHVRGQAQGGRPLRGRGGGAATRLHRRGRRDEQLSGARIL